MGVTVDMGALLAESAVITWCEVCASGSLIGLTGAFKTSDRQSSRCMCVSCAAVRSRTAETRSSKLSCHETQNPHVRGTHTHPQ